MELVQYIIVEYVQYSIIEYILYREPSPAFNTETSSVSSLSFIEYRIQYSKSVCYHLPYILHLCW